MHWLPRTQNKALQRPQPGEASLDEGTCRPGRGPPKLMWRTVSSQSASQTPYQRQYTSRPTTTPHVPHLRSAGCFFSSVDGMFHRETLGQLLALLGSKTLPFFLFPSEGFWRHGSQNWSEFSRPMIQTTTPAPAPHIYDIPPWVLPIAGSTKPLHYGPRRVYSRRRDNRPLSVWSSATRTGSGPKVLQLHEPTQPVVNGTCGCMGVGSITRPLRTCLYRAAGWARLGPATPHVLGARLL